MSIEAKYRDRKQEAKVYQEVRATPQNLWSQEKVLFRCLIFIDRNRFGTRKAGGMERWLGGEPVQEGHVVEVKSSEERLCA